ncbi:5'-methylthioadenosine/adenosylhomocysteine nucleosidase [Loigolactobacillus backii]|uniref:5'-methylthioadenosine/adenosylhomocysteine nucleosidase n=1 Tax=Loigolactobacillus backii TaxID=375175 RepID=UPI0007F06153|nr:5'-methylthioadenosine/adenosylhomocysteine nucleosidase [Loigolactobacillus backii]ANK59727.1 5'-methylthioadenosine nucleosidase [Loigolactobacillus backii]ANK64722.1 5'-methylthioadenosine nucleosidase [Loigolactobacillus backii]ANK66829.1 5'-methylthioadenosine nucleosidase [Loigolactobacillus backii]MDA5387134.1 5'-methylthioadenosine/adenosylhomocysteine nucleosidase [Loigolactobacillus backii]MDA5389643.1 5'-methylthioadenosine/adenosylhomocysteine nucleosidase [Loigolactobacillus ba
MKIGIIGAMEEEVKLLQSKMDNLTHRTIAGVDFYNGVIADQTVILVRSGIGKVQAGMTTGLLLDHYAPDVVINTGSAGGIGSGLKIGDVVISSELAYHDVDATAFGYVIGQLPQQAARFSADKAWVRRVAAAAQQVALTTHVGLIVSGDQFIAGKAATDKILANFPDALASEMEGAAIAQVATQFKVPFVVIRAMSDVGDENAGVNFDDFIIDAGKQSAQMVLALIDQVASV